jgi:hypothetical protein
MSPESRSALSVQFDLRPAKQVERRMLVDAFQRLGEAGFSIRDYRYVGFGSIHFVDFVIFHKLLGIADMLSVEHDPKLEGRVRFNSPFDCIDLKMDSSTNVIPTLSPDDRHILWLDYDEPVSSTVTEDVYMAGSQLSRGSILLVTVDVEPPVKGFDDAKTSREYFEREVGKYLGGTDIRDFTESNLHKMSRRVIMNALKEGMSGRRRIHYFPLFYFLYADEHRMMTVGGIIGSSEEKRNTESMNVEGAAYFRKRLGEKEGPYQIVVPVITRKERHLMDSAMPCEEGWQPKDFAMPAADVSAYREIYRFLPAYAELLL